jgi:hypothetical protein
MPTRKVQNGQVWKHDTTGDTFLITKLYTEALSTFAVLRKTGSETDPVVRVRIGNSGDGQTLPGYTPTQDFDNL